MPISYNPMDHQVTDYMTPSPPLIPRLCLVGMGLMGSSLARAARKYHVAKEIIATDTSAFVRERVQALGLVDHIMEDPTQAVKEADVVILCVPVGAIDTLVRTLVGYMKEGTILSDVGSVKKYVLETILPLLPPHVTFIPAHPVAGTEYSGPDAGFARLFEKRWCILTPPQGADPQAITLLEQFWQSLGAQVAHMSAEHHDVVLAMTSHIPHLIAYNIVGTAADLEAVTQSEIIKFSAGGFRDFTRIAASDPTMWRDIFLHNKEAVLEILGRFTEDLAALQRMIRWGDGAGLFELFTRTRAIRRSIIQEGQEVAAPDFGRHQGDEE